VSRWSVGLLLSLVACTSRGAPELAGDHAYGAGRYAEALTEFRAATGRTTPARVWAKLGAAALHAGDLRAAAEAYRRLAVEDPSRTEEAAEGLDMVARAAARGTDAGALRDAVLGLQAVAPQRPIARYALALVQRSGGPGDAAAALLPAAMAAAPDAATFDSLLGAYAATLQATGGCEPAAPVYRAVLRRTRDGGVRGRVGAGLATCALSLGVAALGGGRADDAAAWFLQAVRVDSTSWTGRRALIGLGDARVGQGDIFGAAIAFQSVLDGRIGATDSLAAMAADRLRSLGAAGPMGASGDTIDGRSR
jgi:tetratricopeptide (TPR) repeat protein